MATNAETGVRHNTLTVGVIAAVALLGGVVSEVGRVALKGADYAYAAFSDIHYYTAMAMHLWQGPTAVRAEMSAMGYSPDLADYANNYAEGGVFAPFLHAVNGLSHQPPYAYRVFGPTAAGLLNDAGVSVSAAFLLLYLLGTVLLAVFAYGLVARSFRPAVVPAVVAAGATIAALATTSPGYPDMSFLGFATFGVWAAARQRPWVFVVASILAAASRETGILLLGVWLAYAWAARRHWTTGLLPAAAPVLTLLVIRVVVEIPDPSVDYSALVSDLASQRTLIWAFWGGCAIVTIGLITPRIARIAADDGLPRIAHAETFVWFVGAAWALAAMLLATNSPRMALLSLPLFLAPSGWLGARSRWWVAAAAVATLGYTVSDTLANRADARFGPWPWAVTAIAVVLVQVVASLRDRRRHV